MRRRLAAGRNSGRVMRTKQFEKEILRQREEEQRVLNEIAAAASLEFAQQAAGVLDSRKHLYSMEGYLVLLNNLKELLYADMPDRLALESVQCGYGVETILAMWKCSNV